MRTRRWTARPMTRASSTSSTTEAMAHFQRLALFDLDHTLIPFDSGREWLLFLAERGAVDAAVERRYLDACRSYVTGRAGLEALHRAVVGPVSTVAEAQL